MGLAIGNTARYLLEIDNGQGLLVRISQAGELEYGPDYSPDASARVFWEALADYFPNCPDCGRRLGNPA